MKRTFLFLLFFISCIISSTLKADEIDMSGDYAATKSRSLIPPVQAFITGQSIETDFNDALGTINVFIYDETGKAVYQQSVNTNAEYQIFIDISSFNPGNYTIEFVNSQDQYLEGSFVIE